MKRIYNTITNQTIWRGESYIVDGQEVTVDLPLVLLTEKHLNQPENSNRIEYREGNFWVFGYETFEAAVEVPESVESWQAKIVLIESGFYNAVIAAIEQLPEPSRTRARVAWNANADFHRNGEFVNLLISMIPTLTDEIADNLFIQAAKIKS